MVNNFENSSNNTENQSNDWDMSDVAEFVIPEQPTEKIEMSEEEREYEQKERGLQDELFAIAEHRAHAISEAGEEFYGVMNRAEHSLAKRMHDSFDNLSQGKNVTDRAYLESFFGYVNEMFPPEFSGRERDEKRVMDAEDLFQKSAFNESSMMDGCISDIAKLFTTDGSERDLQISSNIRNLGQSAAEFPTRLANAIIGYCSEPGKDKRHCIDGIQKDHKGAVSRSLFNIADVFSGSSTEVGKHMFDPTISLTGQIAYNAEQYQEGIMKYLKFKMEASYDKYKLEDNPENHNPKADLFL